MMVKIFITIAAAVLGVGLANSPLKRYEIFNIIMDFFAAGGMG